MHTNGIFSNSILYRREQRSKNKKIMKQKFVHYYSSDDEDNSLKSKSVRNIEDEEGIEGK